MAKKLTVREMRDNLGMTQSEFAGWFGIPLSTVQSWEHGMRNPPQYVRDMMERICGLVFSEHHDSLFLLENSLFQKFGSGNVMSNVFIPAAGGSFGFYVEPLDCFIDVYSDDVHGGHWYDFSDAKDASTVREHRTFGSCMYYHKHFLDVWCGVDVKKRRWAEEHDVNYVVFWDKDGADMNRWFDYGCPVGQDWKHEYSWMDGLDLKRDLDGMCFIKEMGDDPYYDDFEVTRDFLTVVQDKYVVNSSWVDGQLCFDAEHNNEDMDAFLNVLCDPRRRAFVLAHDPHIQYEFANGNPV